MRCLLFLVVFLAATPIDQKTSAADPSGAIWTASLNGKHPKHYMTGLNKPFAIALDSSRDMLYLSNANVYSIKKVDLRTGQGTTIVEHQEGVRGLAIDPKNERIYWTNGRKGDIWMADFDGKLAQVVVKDPDGAGAAGIVVDPGNSLYWANEKSGKIWYFKFQAKRPEVVMTGLAAPCGLALDPGHGTLYLTNANVYSIKKQDLHTGQGTTIVENQEGAKGLALDLMNARLYWTNNSSGEIWRSDLKGQHAKKLVSGVQKPAGIALDRAKNRMYWTGVE